MSTRALSSIVASVVITLGSANLAYAGSCGSSKATLTANTPNIVQTAVAAGSFDTLVTAVKAAGLAETLQGDGPFTVFAPTDEAFAALPAGTVEKLLDNPAKLRAILKYHVVAGKVDAAAVTGLTSAKTLLGQEVSVRTHDGVRINKAQVT